MHGVYPDGNTGFGTGMNIGVDAARGLGAREFLLLNPDATIEPDQLAVLRGAVAADPSRSWPRSSSGRTAAPGSGDPTCTSPTGGSARPPAAPSTPASRSSRG
ncbi:hypothetical protein [Clavibacter tessellarius]|uniref:hypothetical protein n=1 Tax=Clavibacter tessellarius TaxID=31965 RepID=UPI003243553E